MHPGVDKNSMSYKIAMESFNDIAMTLPSEDRLGYRNIAMEAVTGPDTGMVLDRLYKSVNARSSVNFGQIPASCGDLTQFAKYKTISESLALLDRDIGDMKVEILKDSHLLHDNIIRLKPDFSYGYKMDSQFLKTTYCSMVYALCEIINLCIVVYVDVLKAKVNNKPFKMEDYSNLMLVQNVRKFNKMVSSGEWAQMMVEMKRNAKAFSGDSAGGLGAFAMELVRTVGGGGTAAVGIVAGGRQLVKNSNALYDNAVGAMAQRAEKRVMRKTGDDILSGNAMATVMQKYQRSDDVGVKKAIGMAIKNVWNSVPGKVIIILTTIIVAVIILRSLICLFWKATYGLRDILDDQVKLLEANASSDQNTATATEKQVAMLNSLTGLRDTISKKIIKDDVSGKNEVTVANTQDMRKQDLPGGETSEVSDLDFG